MLKIFRDGVAVDISKIQCIIVEKIVDEVTPFEVRAYFNGDDDYAVLEWFATKLDAEMYVEKLVAEINRR